MTDTPDDDIDARISERLHDVLTMIMCPIAGCWSLHGCRIQVLLSKGGSAP